MATIKYQKGKKELEQFRAQVKYALENLRYHGWDGSVFFDKGRPELKKLAGIDEERAKQEFITERQRHLAEATMLQGVVTLYTSYLTCPADEDAEMIIESAYEDFRTTIRKRKREMARRQGLIIALDAHGYEKGVTVDQKLKDYDHFRDNFMRWCEMLDKTLNKIKENRNA